MKFILEAPQQARWVTGTDRIGFNVIRHLQRLDVVNRYLVICNPDFPYVCSAITGSNFGVIPRRARSRMATVLGMPMAAIRLTGRRLLRPVDAFCSFHNLSSPPVKYSPTISFALDLIPLVFPHWYHSSLPARRLYETRLERATRNVDRFIAISEHTKSDLISRLGIPSSRIEVAYLAADQMFRPQTDPDVLSEVRHRYKLPQRFLLTAGSNEPRKNVRTVINAFSRLREGTRRSCPLVVMGPVWGNESAIGTGDSVLEVGEIADPDLPAVYSLASGFVFLSLYEGFGLPAVEAMACGTPVLVSSTTSVPEVVADAGVLVHPEDVVAITSCLEKLIEDRAMGDRLSTLGLKRAQDFSWESTTKVVFDSLMAVSSAR